MLLTQRSASNKTKPAQKHASKAHMSFSHHYNTPRAAVQEHTLTPLTRTYFSHACFHTQRHTDPTHTHTGACKSRLQQETATHELARRRCYPRPCLRRFCLDSSPRTLFKQTSGQLCQHIRPLRLSLLSEALLPQCNKQEKLDSSHASSPAEAVQGACTASLKVCAYRLVEIHEVEISKALLKLLVEAVTQESAVLHVISQREQKHFAKLHGE